MLWISICDHPNCVPNADILGILVAQLWQSRTNWQEVGGCQEQLVYKLSIALDADAAERAPAVAVMMTKEAHSVINGVASPVNAEYLVTS